MKKLLFIFCLLSTMSACCFASHSTNDDQAASNAQSTSVEAVKRTKQQSKLKNKMIVMGAASHANASVAYLLLENGKVLIMTSGSTFLPFTSNEARIILQNAEKPIYHCATMIENQSNGSKILVVTGANSHSETSVIYILNRNGQIQKFCSQSTWEPFTLAQARVIMADIGSEISYYSDEK